MHKAGIYFHVVIAIITSIIGISFLKSIAFLSVIFFLATATSIILAYKEYKIQPLSTEEINSYENEIKIKTSKSISVIIIFTHSVIVTISAFFLSLVLKKETDFFFSIVTIMPIAVMIGFIFMIYKEIKKMNSNIIVISRKGIQILKKPFMNWCDIENEKIISRFYTVKESKHDNRSEINYLLFYYKNERMEIPIDELNITDSQLNQYLKIFRAGFNNEKLRLQQL